MINIFEFHAFTPKGSELSKYKVEGSHDLYSRSLRRRAARWLNQIFGHRLAGKFYREFCSDPYHMQFGPKDGRSDIHAKDIVTPRWDEAPDSYDFLNYLGRKVPPAS